MPLKFWSTIIASKISDHMTSNFSIVLLVQFGTRVKVECTLEWFEVTRIEISERKLVDQYSNGTISRHVITSFEFFPGPKIPRVLSRR